MRFIWFYWCCIRFIISIYSSFLFLQLLFYSRKTLFWLSDFNKKKINSRQSDDGQKKRIWSVNIMKAKGSCFKEKLFFVHKELLLNITRSKQIFKFRCFSKKSVMINGSFAWQIRVFFIEIWMLKLLVNFRFEKTINLAHSYSKHVKMCKDVCFLRIFIATRA